GAGGTAWPPIASCVMLMTSWSWSVAVGSTPRRYGNRSFRSWPLGLRLSEEKTTIAHLDEGFEFLGFRIQRQTKRGSHHRYVYTWVARRSLTSIKAKVKTITRQGTNNPLKDLLRQLNPVLRGWTNYFQHAVAKQTFSYLQEYT